jgi:Bacterial Ig-like domain (group 2)
MAESRSSRARRARRIALARSRAARARNASTAPPQIDRGQLAFMATIVERQLESSFPSVVENRIVAAGLRASPLLLLKPSWRRDGIGGNLSNPQLLGAGLVVGLTIAGELRRKSQDVRDVRITRSYETLPVDGSITFRADALDESGRVIGEKRQTIHWDSSKPEIATVDPNSGLVTAVKPGNVTITATGERPELSDAALVTVNSATG